MDEKWHPALVKEMSLEERGQMNCLSNIETGSKAGEVGD